MKKIPTAIAAAIAIPAAAYAQAGPAPADTARPTAGMMDHSECLKMHGMMMSMTHGSGFQSGHPMMNGGNGQAQMMKPETNPPAAAPHQQYQQ
ncbi:MAG: hypothetical protein M3438_10045 [Pseudomonadota bacterium]|nr:hypothetical protein [Pseudomonadota bacterium]